MNIESTGSHIAYIGLGANLGDRQGQIRTALKMLSEIPGIDVVRCSPLYETEPVGPPQPMYLNAVAELRVTMTPLQLLEHLLQTEKRLGRQRNERWGPRYIDLDLLMFDDLHYEDEHLTLPHPHMAERDFVLVPLSDINLSLASAFGFDRSRANKSIKRWEEA